jgi:hypothetical protein
MAAVAITAAHFLRPRPAGEPRRHRDLLLAGVVSIVAFLGASPFLLFSLREFWDGFHGQVLQLQAGSVEDHLPMRAWRYHFVYTLPRGLTWPIFLAGLGGLLGAFLRDWRRALVVYCYPLAFYALIGWSWVGVARYVTAMLPFLALAASWLLVQAAAGTAAVLGWTPRARGRLAAALVLLVCAGSVVEVGNLLRLLRGVDSRHTMATWASEHLPDGATIGWLGTLSGRPPLAERPESLQRRFDLALRDGTVKRVGGSGRLLRKKIELASRGERPRFLLLDLCREPSKWHEELPEYLLVERYRMYWTQKQTSRVEQWLETGDYYELNRWSVTHGDAPLPYCDPQDGVYLPFGQLGQARWSGPELVLYKRQPLRQARR